MLQLAATEFFLAAEALAVSAIILFEVAREELPELFSTDGRPTESAPTTVMVFPNEA